MGILNKKNSWTKELNVAQRKLQLERILSSKMNVYMGENYDSVTLSKRSIELSKLYSSNKSEQID